MLKNQIPSYNEFETSCNKAYDSIKNTLMESTFSQVNNFLTMIGRKAKDQFFFEQ